MTPDKDKELCEKYPLLYRDRHKSMYETCMCWGFEVSEGWTDLIDGLSAQLEPLIAEMPDTCCCNHSKHEGACPGRDRRIPDLAIPETKSRLAEFYYRYVRYWCIKFLYAIFGRWITEPCICEKYEDSRPAAAQVKSKFAGLRFYMSGDPTSQMHELIDLAEKNSYRICEECGSPGRYRPGSWAYTLCDKCHGNKHAR